MPSFFTALNLAKSSAKKSGGGRKANKDTDRNEADRDAATENTPPVIQPAPEKPVNTETPVMSGDETPPAEDNTPTPAADDERPVTEDPAANDDMLYSLSGSREFSGRSDVINVSGDDLAQVESATIALSFNADRVSGTRGLLSRDAAARTGDGNHLSAYIEDGTLNVRFQDGVAGNGLILSYGNIQANQDYQIALTFGSGRAKLAVNGEVVDSGQTGISWSSSPEYLQIGALGWNSDSGTESFSNVFDGTISDVAIYDGRAGNTKLASLSNGNFTPEPMPPVVEEDDDTPTTGGDETPPAEDNTPTPTTGESDVSSVEDDNAPQQPAANDDMLYSLSGSREFSGRSDVINVSGDDLAQVESATIALSFNADRVSGTRGLLSRDAAARTGDGNHLSAYIEDGTLNVRFQDGVAGNGLILSYGNIQANQDYQIALTFGSGRAKLAVNGEVVDSGQTGISWSSSPEYLQIGALGWNSDSGTESFSNVFDGTISDVAIYDGRAGNTKLASLSNGNFTPEPMPPVVEEDDDTPTTGGDETPPAEDNTPTPTTGESDVSSVEDDNAPQQPAANDDMLYSLSGSREFSGRSDVINVSGDDLAQVESATIALSFNADRVSGTRGLLSRDAAARTGDGNHLSAYIEDGTLNVRFQDGVAGNGLILSYGNIQANQDYQIALTFGSGRAKLAVNGEVVDSGQTGISWSSSPEYLQIGALGWNSDSGTESFSNVFDGTISDVAIYDGRAGNTKLASLSNGNFTPEPMPPVVEEDDDTPTTGGDETPPAEDNTPTPAADDETPVTEDPADPTPTTGGQDTNSGGGDTTPIDVSSNFSVAGGRVTTLQVDNHENVDSIRILNGPDHGNLTVNPDNTLALVMSHEPDFSGRIDISYEVTYANGSTQVYGSRVNVQTATQQDGWGGGKFYMLEEDENGDVVVEHGDNHREVYISGDNDALSLRDIAALEGVSTSQITQNWLASHSEYGSSEDMALDAEAGMRLWRGITGEDTEPSSHWLLFERGYEYNDLGRIVDNGTTGEDGLHPIHITSYGDGSEPVLNGRVSLYQQASQNIVFSNVAITGGISALGGENLLFDDVDVSMIDGNGTTGFSIHNVDGLTLHNSSVTDVYRTEPTNAGADSWSNHMSSGLYIYGTDNVLVEDSLFDHNGWAPDYEYDMSTDGGLPPTMFNHNIYVDLDTTDITFRDNVIMRGASFGLKLRPGGFVEDNVLLDNNNGATILGGIPGSTDEIRTGSFSLVSDNLVTSAGYKQTDSGSLGAVSRGADIVGMDVTLIDNIIAHLADPNNLGELGEKPSGEHALMTPNERYYDDTIIYNWEGGISSHQGSARTTAEDQNIDGLNTSVLDATTIQRFTQQLLGDPNAGIPDLADFLRAQADGSLDHYVDADLIIDFFQTGFGLDVDGRVGSEELQFIPNDLGDGIRWDNRLNWSTEDLPGTVSGDSVDLGGNWVNYGGTNTINNFDLGDGGMLDVNNGRLNVEGRSNTGEDGGTIDVSNVGQIWMNGYRDSDELTLNVTGGRFANTGDMSGNSQATISDGQAILATGGANYDIEAGSELHIDGSDASVGFDGDDGDTAVMRLSEDGTLSFSADRNGFAGIEEFRSGAFGDDTDVASGANLGLGALELDLAGLSGTTGSFDLLSVDEMIGEFSDIRITGLAGNRNAELVVDYRSDMLTLNVTGGGRGDVALSQIGEEGDMDHGDANDIWAALTAGQGTYSDNRPTELEVNGEDVVLNEMLV